MSATNRPPLACAYCRQIVGHAPTCITYVAAALERVRPKPGSREQEHDMTNHGTEVGVDWENGLVLHENDAEWHPWDEAEYGPRPVHENRSNDA